MLSDTSQTEKLVNIDDVERCDSPLSDKAVALEETWTEVIRKSRGKHPRQQSK